LKFAPSVENQRKTYGAFAAPLQDYANRKVLDRFRTVEGTELIREADPFSFRERVTIPKYIVNVSGDQFYPPDSSHYYINNLNGETRIRYVANTDHGGSGTGFVNAVTGILAWTQNLIIGGTRPSVNWNLLPGQNLQITVNNPAATALLWSASNPNARDFRLETIGPTWISTPVVFDLNGQATVELDTPPAGWSGYFVEVTFPGLAGIPEKYSTPVYIFPVTRPFTLEQPILDPKSRTDWTAILDNIVSGNQPNPSLAASFPIRAIGDVSVATIEAAHSLLNAAHVSSKTRSQQECLTTRLNIKDDQIGWYSEPEGNITTWSLWNLADLLYRSNVFFGSTIICASLNAL
jgi:hypothetical protein